MTSLGVSGGLSGCVVDGVCDVALDRVFDGVDGCMSVGEGSVKV